MIPHEELDRIADGAATALLDGVRYRRITLDLTTGFKYQLNQRVEWKILTPGITILQDYEDPNGYYSVTTDGTIVGEIGCGYDGPTKFPDVDWMMLPSLVHDILHWLIDIGIIPESCNHLIDEELGAIIAVQQPKSWWGKKWRGFRSW